MIARTKTPLGLSMEELSACDEWKALSPIEKKVLSLYFTDALVDHNLIDAVGSFHRDFSRTKQVEVAENLLKDEKVKAVIALYFGQQQL